MKVWVRRQDGLAAFLSFEKSRRSAQWATNVCDHRSKLLPELLRCSKHLAQMSIKRLETLPQKSIPSREHENSRSS